MKKHLLKRILPVLLALALLVSAAPHAAVQAQAAPSSGAEAGTAQKEAKSAAKAGLPERPEGDGEYWDIDEDEVIGLALGKELELCFAEDQNYMYLRFVPDADGLYRFESFGDLDVYVELMDEDGYWLNADDDGGTGLNFCLSAVLAADTVYYFLIWFYGTAADSPFTVLLTKEEFEPIDLELDQELELSFEEDQTDIWLSFVPAASGNYRLASKGQLDVYVRLMDQYGCSLNVSDDYEDVNFCLTEYLQAGHTYYYDVGYYVYDEVEDTHFSVLLTKYEPVTSGLCGAQGDNLVWSYDWNTGTLTIEGRGEMMNFDDMGSAPWFEFHGGISTVELPEGLTSIGDYAFYNCTQLYSLNIPEGVERIGICAFVYCYELRSVSLPESLTTIDNSAFACCSSLSELTIPSGVTYIGHSAFEYCSFREITIPEGVTEIYEDTFLGCSHLSTATIPDSVTAIGAGAFQNCCELTDVTLPSGLTAIEERTFMNCWSLSAVNIPDGVTTIGQEAFWDCPLTSVELPAGIEEIGAGAFTGSDPGLLVIRRADCVVGYMEEGVDPDETDEDLDDLLMDRSLGSVETEIYGRHDQDKLDNDPLDDNYRYAEAYAAAYGYAFFDLYAFSDVKEYSWYEIPVAWANGMGITSGTGNGKFSPKASCLREQVMTFLWAAAGKPEPTLTENPFTDVNPNKYYAKAVLWAYENGITTGATATTFGVGKVCSRAQVVTFLYGAAGKPKPTGKTNPFTDVKETDYFYDAVLWAVENGITGGTSPTTFSPKQTCTRAQVVTFLYAAAHLSSSGRGDDDEVYEAVFGEYAELMEASRLAATDDERYVLEAQAEAALLDTAAMIPLATKGGAYAMSRVAPHTKSPVQWGGDGYRLHSLVVSDEFLTTAERDELEARWEAALAGTGTYDPAAYLTSQGHSLSADYTTTFSADPSTLDWLSTASGSDNMILANCVEGLIEYDNLGKPQPALAESWEVSDDGLTWTFHIREGVYWYTSAGEPWAELTANDFVAGFHHMLDSESGLESLAGTGGAEIEGVDEYLYEGGSFDAVGCEATDDHTLVYTLKKPVSFFKTMLSYNIFLPLCDSFYRARGGVYGIDEYWEAVGSESWTFGLVEDVSSQVYCGPFLPQTIQWENEIRCVKNPGYYKAEEVTLNSITWRYAYNYSPYELYNGALSGMFDEVTLDNASGQLGWAIADGNFARYAYVTETDAVTYFGGLNLNRGTYELEGGDCASPKTEQERADTSAALLNLNFRKALQHAFDKTTYNAVSRGEELAETNLRNMYTPPEFVKLEHAVTDADGHTFPAGTFYGDMVQYYCDLRGCLVDCADGQDGWYKPEAARDYLALAIEELGDSVSWPIQIDVVYYYWNDAQTDKAWAYKNSIEDVLGSEYVFVNLIEAYGMEDYYNCCYWAESGKDGNFDFCRDSGWGPDYGDPATYLNTFDRGVGGYMLKFVGLY